MAKSRRREVSFITKKRFTGVSFRTMNIRYVNEFAGVDWQQVSRIISVVGWGARSPEKLEHAFKNSSFIRFAYDENQLIGMGRTVDDGVYYGWIVDLAILPEYQGNGIGSYILEELEKDLKPFVTTMLTAAHEKGGFYEKRGWLKQTAAYIWPRSEEQKRIFSE